MKATWTQADREAAYTALCEAVTAAGPEHETQLLARLSLLLAEELVGAEATEVQPLRGVGLRGRRSGRQHLVPRPVELRPEGRAPGTVQSFYVGVPVL